MLAQGTVGAYLVSTVQSDLNAAGIPTVTVQYSERLLQQIFYHTLGGFCRVDRTRLQDTTLASVSCYVGNGGDLNGYLKLY